MDQPPRETPSPSAGKAVKRDTPSVPQVSLPKGGGAIRGIGEKFAANPVTGTGSMSVPVATSPGRSGFGPQLSLSYDSGSGNGPFGFGWTAAHPSVARKTDKGLPQCLDAADSDVFMLSGAEDLVPVYRQMPSGAWARDAQGNLLIHEDDIGGFRVRRYRPRTEGLFARIERWSLIGNPADVHWRSISKDNVLTLYGRDANSRIVDPEDAGRVFSWLICESRDDKGNAVLYRYKAEDGRGVDPGKASERNRGAPGDARRTAGRYLKRIFYGNREPLLDGAGDRPRFLNQALIDSQIAKAGWMFEVVFDYGEHDALAPLPNDTGAWGFRADAFSNYRPGFEVRTTRLCRRVLMFHHFPGEAGVGRDCLVRSTDFTYTHQQHPSDPRNPTYTFLAAVTQAGYRRSGAGYLRRTLPPVEFEYTQPVIEDTVRDIDDRSLENLPIGVDGLAYQWTDLHGEGIPGILTEQADAWFYKRNLTPIGRNAVEFAAQERVATKPRGTPTPALAQFIDLAGDGTPDLVVLDGPTPGFSEHDDAEGWEPFRAFVSRLNRDMRDPNLRLVDLDGDGLADVLITEDDALVWHASLAEDGFGPARRVAHALDEEKGPRVVFDDGTQSVYLADMSGDGLTDLVRIRNDEVCYWPNLGHGRFGAKVTMDNAPRCDHPDQFDHKRIRLADIDGTGTSDLIYLHREGVRICFNQAGNGWSEPRLLRVSPRTEDLASIAPTDLLGNGTACLVWSSPMPGDTRRPMRYVNLMGEHKPHLLVKAINNLGAETRIGYAPSTKFYLQDRRDGRPWITKLPFPVHVVERIETIDHVGRNRFVTRRAYHHGYFDGPEREFRGFGMVEQWDTEEFAALSVSDAVPSAANLDAASHVPPVLTKTWFHTGLYLGRDHVSDFFAGLLDGQASGEYYREPGATPAQARALLLPDTVLPTGLSVDEEREACRALKGSMLRQEIYALDRSARQPHPYSVAEQNFSVRLEQPRGKNMHAVFLTHSRESITRHCERNPIDPRMAHALTLEVDGYGNVLKAASIAYGRRMPDATLPLQSDRDTQTRRLVTYTETRVTNPIDDVVAHPGHYRTPLHAETRTSELTALKPEGGAARFSFDEWVRGGVALPASASDIPYEQTADQVSKQRRVIEHVRTLYRPDDLGSSVADPSALLPLGALQRRALGGQTFQLALTPGLISQVFQRNGAPLLPNPAGVLGGQAADRGGYLPSQQLKAAGLFPNSDPADHWWVPGGRVFLSPGSVDTAAQELSHATQHFFAPHRARDPFHSGAVGTESVVRYDAHDLLAVETRDALGNRTSVGERLANGSIDATKPGNDYRVLQPLLVTDPNCNRVQVAFDALGMVVGTAVMGKPEESFGDSLAGFVDDLTDVVALGHLSNPLSAPQAILGRASTRLVYDLFAYQRTKAQPSPQPPVAYALARETHDSDPVPPGGLEMRHSFAYSDGFGREIQTKIRAEAGPVPQRGANGKVVVGADGQPTPTPNAVSPRWIGSGWTVFNNKGLPVRRYEPFFTDTHRFEFDVRIGVSPVLFYDPVGRVVATLHPNHSWEKVVFDPWRQQTWDVNDTVLVADPKADADVGAWFARLPTTDYLPSWLAQRAGGQLGAQQQAAAVDAAMHAETPLVAHADALGRPFLSIAHNKLKYSDMPAASPPVEERLHSRVVFDIEGNQRAVVDALNRVVLRCDYDMLDHLIRQASMEAGTRWMLVDAAGQPLQAWDSRDHRLRSAYDALRRPTHMFMQQGASAELLTGRTVYGEAQPNPEARNLRGRVVQVFDQAGVASSAAYDFKGNLLRGQRQLANAYSADLDWSSSVPLDAPIYASSTRYDALNRPVQLIAPHSDQPGAAINAIQPAYNAAALLEQVHVWLGMAAEPAGLLATGSADLHPVTNIDRDAKGQRVQIDYGNGAQTTYAHDPLTLRLTHLQTRRGGTDLQDLSYTYDPAGNIADLRDDAQPTVFFNKARVGAGAAYRYDALYRLIEASGREHLGRVGAAPLPASYNDAPRTGQTFAASDGNALGRYLERYVYDAVGNFGSMKHIGTDPANPGWMRTYTYGEASLLEAGKKSNRLTRTATNLAAPETYDYDAHGNMLRMPQLQELRWDFKDRLRMTQRQVVNASDAEGTAHHGERTWYVYDADGQRVRKVTELASGALKDERIYLGSFEIYRKAGVNPLVRETLHVMDDKQRIALVEARTGGSEPGVPRQLVRYQFGNHLGSASLELDDGARIVSYEEYTPYGSTSYQAVSSLTETPKRYRYTGKERDEESGLNYHGARYYATWLGRWTSCDPIFLSPSETPNQACGAPYTYVRNRPTMLQDPDGCLDDEAVAILNHLQNLADEIPEREFPGLAANSQGTRAHLALESEITTGKAPAGVNIQRIAAEVQIDDAGIIRGVGTTPGAAKKGWRTIDAALLKKDVFHVQGFTKQSGFFSNLVGQKASDVIELAVDYKTGQAAMQHVEGMEKLIGAPYLKLSARALGGNIVESAAARLPPAAAVAAESVAADASLSAAADPKPAKGTGPARQTRAAALRPGQAGSVDPALAKAVAGILGKAVEGALVIGPLAVQPTPEDSGREAVGMVLGMGAIRLAMAYPLGAVGVVGAAVTFYEGAALGENAQRSMNDAASNADPSKQGPYRRTPPKSLLDMFHF